MAKSSTSKFASKMAFYVPLIIILAVTLFPFIWMVLASLKTNVDILNVDRLFVFTPTLQNFFDIFISYDFIVPIKNSSIVSFGATIIALLLGLPAAYSIARERQHLFAGIILVIRIIPAISFLVPWYILFNRLHLTGTYTALIICNLIVSLPLIIWIMIPYYETLPHELEQAAWIDGCSRLGTFIRIMLPLSSPGILTAAVLSFIFSWNNFMFALILCTGETRTLPIAIYQFIAYSEINWGGLMAAAVMITLPIIALSLFLQRYIITGLTAGAVKG